MDDGTPSRDIRDPALLPPWLAQALEDERGLFPDSRFPQELGSPGYQVYHLGFGVWAWDNGTGGVIISDGRLCGLPGGLVMVRWINASELDVPHDLWTDHERAVLGDMVAQFDGHRT